MFLWVLERESEDLQKKPKMKSGYCSDLRENKRVAEKFSMGGVVTDANTKQIEDLGPR